MAAADSEWMQHIESKIASIEKAVAENTDLTRDIRDALVFARVGSKLLKWLSAIAASLAAIWAAWPHGHGK